MKEKFDENKYKQQYNKNHYKRFVADLKVEEFDELQELLKKNNLTKSQFVRNYIGILKKCK